MLNLKTIGIEPYQFADGDTVITTNSPTQGFWKELQASRNSKDSMEVVDYVLDFMLKEEDKHYVTELPFQVKIMVMKDYIEFHAQQLESSFRDTASK